VNRLSTLLSTSLYCEDSTLHITWKARAVDKTRGKSSGAHTSHLGRAVGTHIVSMRKFVSPRPSRDGRSLLAAYAMKLPAVSILTRT
jgi:hypothetical protein